MPDRCQPRFGGTDDAPFGVELGAQRVVLDVLEPWQAVGERAHVAAALDVVLAAQRVDAAAVPPDMAGEQHKRDQGKDVVDGVVVLGDAERPADHRARGAVASAWASSRMASAGTPVSRSAYSSVYDSTLAL